MYDYSESADKVLDMLIMANYSTANIGGYP
jgi:hypothetical protein